MLRKIPKQSRCCLSRCCLSPNNCQTREHTCSCDCLELVDINFNNLPLGELFMNSFEILNGIKIYSNKLDDYPLTVYDSSNPLNNLYWGSPNADFGGIGQGRGGKKGKPGQNSHTLGYILVKVNKLNLTSPYLGKSEVIFEFENESIVQQIGFLNVVNGNHKNKIELFDAHDQLLKRKSIQVLGLNSYQEICLQSKRKIKKLRIIYHGTVAICYIKIARCLIQQFPLNIIDGQTSGTPDYPNPIECTEYISSVNGDRLI